MGVNGALGPIILVAAISGGAATAPRPALEALMPGLATTPDELVAATAAWSAIDSAGFLLGAGGAAIAIAGAGAVTALAAALFAVAALLAVRLPWVKATEVDERGRQRVGSGMRSLGCGHLAMLRCCVWAWRVAARGRLSALAFGAGRSRARAVYLLVLVADVPGGDDYSGSDDCNSHGG